MPQGPGGGMQIPEPGGSMKKMHFEFADPAEQQMQQQQAQMQQAAIPPAGAGGGQPPQQGAMPPQGMPQGGLGSMMGGQAPQGDPSMQGGMSAGLSDDALAGMLGQDQGPIDPMQVQADALEQQLATDPELQMQMMQAARRMGGF